MSGSKVDLKVVLLGKEFGGKTSLVERYLHDRFSGDTCPYQNTIGAAFGAKRIEVNGKNFIMGIWDTAGSERYEAMVRIFYRGARAAIICYDLSDASSFERVKFWVQELKQHEETCKIYLCGTKKDLICSREDRKIDYHTTTDYGDEIDAPVLETSSKTGENVAQLFQLIARDYIGEASNETMKTEGGIKLTELTPTKPRCCH